MKLVFISDTHDSLQKLEVPDGDVLIHCGDATYRGAQNEMKRFRESMAKLPHKTKIFVPGNHEITLDKNHQAYSKYAKMWLGKELIVLINSEITIDGIKFYGTPIQPEFNEWGFNVKSPELREQFYNLIPDNVDVLITHCPPYGYLDTETGPKYRFPPLRTGCEVLRKRVDEIKPRIHAFGHIHEKYGTIQTKNTLFINACSMNKDYELVNKPIVIDI